MKRSPAPRPYPPPAPIPDLPAGLSEIIDGADGNPIAIRPAPGCAPGHIRLNWDQLAGFKARHNLHTCQVVQWPNAETLIVLEPIASANTVSAETLSTA